MLLKIKDKIVKARKKASFPKSAGIFILLLISLLLLGPASAYSTEQVSGKSIPFAPGEKLKYHGRWGAIEAGQITLEVLPMEIIDGVKAYHFAMITSTNEVVDLIYKIRERQDSYVDSEMTHSLLFKKKTESKHPRDEMIVFNWKKNESTYTNFGETNPPQSVLPGTFDPLALIFAFRVHDIKEKAEISIPLTDGNKVSMIAKATIGKKTTIAINGKSYETYEINPDMKRIGTAIQRKESLDLKIWLTADERKIPVMIHSSVGIITFVFEILP